MNINFVFSNFVFNQLFSKQFANFIENQLQCASLCSTNMSFFLKVLNRQDKARGRRLVTSLPSTREQSSLYDGFGSGGSLVITPVTTKQLHIMTPLNL